MKLFHIIQGTDVYDWEAGARVVLSRFNPTEKQIEAWIDQLDEAIDQKTILWYIGTLSELDPQTGKIVQTTTWDKQGVPKHKIRLNEQARVTTTRHSPKPNWHELLQPIQPGAFEYQEDHQE